MTAATPTRLLLLLSLLTGCGERLVEFRNGSGGDDDDTGDDDDDDEPTGPLSILSTDPESDATGVSITKRVDATFDRRMDPNTLGPLTFLLRQGSDEIAGDVSYADTSHTATFTPSDPLTISLEYTATVTTGAESRAGNALPEDYTWSFTTAACALSPVVLGGAGAFGVLAGSTVTSTGATSVTGDVGVSPSTAIDGFPPGVIVGSKHSSDPAADQAIADLSAAFDAAEAQSLCAMTVDGNLGGQTLPPGLYHSESSLEISSGDLTLDAEGDDDAIFIFQMASTLTVTSGRQVFLTGGARATNVYWQVGSSATLGTTSAFKGTIMADQSITLETGATLDGRALALIAAVTLDANTIVVPAL